ncbi:MAG: hypothetical protein HY457_03400 [Parcubacteria group bacterium]|nr:hypothetical protein [Parcubacteria group bacterium]
MKKFLVPASLFVFPLVALAQQTVSSILTRVMSILNLVIPIVITFALITFLWGVFKYVTAGESDDKKKAIELIAYGLVALFVMVAVWGLVAIVGNTFGIQPGGAAPGVPGIPGAF